MGNGVTRFGTTGIFTAIIMAIVTVLIYRTCVKRNWVIKMPEAVPEGGFSRIYSLDSRIRRCICSYLY